jgi:polysaccharide export outer membrane protein
MFDDLNKGKNLTGAVINNENDRTTIFPDNILRIIVSSGNVMDTKTYEQFNLLPIMPVEISTTRVSNDMEFQSYYVDRKGEIDFPIIGKVKVEGLNHFDLESLLEEKLKTHISEPIVKVTIRNNLVKVFGEVRLPGAYNIGNRDRYSIMDALSDAGDITSFGDKKRVKLIREDNGHLESVVLDLTSTDIFTTPYYYLKRNDILVVDPNKTRRKDAQYGMADNYRLSVISTIIGSVSIIASMIILAANQKQNQNN